VQTAAQTLGVQIRILNVENQEQFDAVLARAVRERIDAIIVPASTVFTNGRARLVASAALHAMPAIYELSDFVAAGGLISYGNSRNAGDAVYQQVGVYAGRILKGERPADLPVVQPTKFEFVINLKTAKALGLTIPETLLATANEVIQ
jgi:putative ABC transport system substrate-binding protein